MRRKQPIDVITHFNQLLDPFDFLQKKLFIFYVEF